MAIFLHRLASQKETKRFSILFLLTATLAVAPALADDCQVKLSEQATQISYYGACESGYASGKGRVRFSTPNGICVTRGEFREGLRHGTSTEECENGSILKGQFVDGKALDAVHTFKSNGIPTALVTRNGNLVEICRADQRGERNCTASRRAQLLGMRNTTTSQRAEKAESLEAKEAAELTARERAYRKAAADRRAAERAAASAASDRVAAERAATIAANERATAERRAAKNAAMNRSREETKSSASPVDSTKRAPESGIQKGSPAKANSTMDL